MSCVVLVKEQAVHYDSPLGTHNQALAISIKYQILVTMIKCLETHLYLQLKYRTATIMMQMQCGSLSILLHLILAQSYVLM